MNYDEDQRRVQALVEALCGKPDEAAIRGVDVIHAQAAALGWVRMTTGRYPAPRGVAAKLQEVAGRLRAGVDDRDPGPVLAEVARQALAEHQAALVIPG